MLLGVLTGPVYDAGHMIPLLYVGSFLVVFGHMMLSLCHRFWQVLLAQSFCVGIGAGLLFVPSIAILSTYFTTKLPFAIGIAASGSSLGGVVYPILIRVLLSKVGFGWSVRIAGFVALFGLSISCAAMRIRSLPAERRKGIDWSAFRELPYALFNLGMFLCFMGLYTPYYYLQSIALEERMVPGNLAFYLLPIMNAASTFGRLAPGYISQITGPFNVLVPCSIISGVLALCLLAVDSEGPLLAFCVLYGFFSGSLVSLSGPILVVLSPSSGVIGTRMGMCFTCLGIALLIGTPIAGAILDSAGARAVWLYSGIFTLAGGLIVGIARMSKISGKLLAKV
jgi:predicted MFS family arabinose efflux permease